MKINRGFFHAFLSFRCKEKSSQYCQAERSRSPTTISNPKLPLTSLIDKETILIASVFWYLCSPKLSDYELD
jgi:hypothetical protein